MLKHQISYHISKGCDIYENKQTFFAPKKEAKAKTKRGETFCKLREPENYHHLLMKNVCFSPIIHQENVIGSDDIKPSYPMTPCHEK